MTTPPLPVYLVHWDAPDWVRSAAASILASDRPIALTIVDNGPPEASADLAELRTRARVIDTGGNLGFAGGANVALRDWLGGGAPWCVIGAHDLHVAATDLGRMLAAGEKAPSYGIIGPGTENGYHAGQYMGESEGLEERTDMSGTCLLLRRECIQEVGLFDEQFGSYGEDTELCVRARRHGWRVGRVPGTSAHGLGHGASHHLRLRGRAIILLIVKTAGRGTAAARLLRYALSLGISLLFAWMPTEHGARRRLTATRAWFALRHGVPVLWMRMQPPPPAPVAPARGSGLGSPR